MTMYTVVPLHNCQFRPTDFENLSEAIQWQEELAMVGILSTIERTESFFIA